MPVSKYFGGKGATILSKMKQEHGAKKGTEMFYAMANKHDAKPKKAKHK